MEERAKNCKGCVREDECEGSDLIRCGGYEYEKKEEE